MGKRIVALAVFLALTGALLPGQAVPPGTGLVAYWTLNDPTDPVALETAGSGPTNTGQYLGNTLPTTSNVVPMVGGLAHPPGNTASRVFTNTTTNQRVEAPDAPDLNLTGNFTLACWVWPTGTPNTQMCLIEKWTSGATAENGYLLRLGRIGDPATGHHVKINIGNGTTQIEAAEYNFAVPTTGWTHVAATWNGTLLRLFRNGQEVASAPAGAGALTASTDPLHLGVDYGANRLTGHLDDARIYDRALSTTELGVLVNGLATPVISSLTPGPGLVDVAWGAVPNAMSYLIFQGPSATGPWTQVGTTSTTTFTDTQVLNPNAYFYQVVAVGLIQSQPSTAQGPVVPQSLVPRTEGHDEGFFDDNCACGSTASPACSPLLLLALAAFARRRRS